jgi:hypothetical protein
VNDPTEIAIGDNVIGGNLYPRVDTQLPRAQMNCERVGTQGLSRANACRARVESGPPNRTARS